MIPNSGTGGTREAWQAGVIGVAAVVLAVVALATPHLRFDDAPGDASAQQIRMLKTEAHHTTTLPPLRMQVTGATATGPAGENVEGTIVFRGPFGVRWAELEIGVREQNYDWQHRNWLLAWGAFIAGEVVLLALLAWRLWSTPEHPPTAEIVS